VEYKFDYIREMVEEWGDGVPKDMNSIYGTPFRISLPLMMPETINGEFVFKYYPARDYYGEPIYDIEEWVKQRKNYCEKLAKKYKKK